MNPFVNPNQRGAELPAGCKDLNELIAKYPHWGEGAVEPGELIALESYLCRFFRSEAAHRFLMITVSPRNVSVSIIYDQGQRDLLIFVNGKKPGLDNTLCEIFGQKAVSPPNAEGNSRLVTIPLLGS